MGQRKATFLEGGLNKGILKETEASIKKNTLFPKLIAFMHRSI